MSTDPPSTTATRPAERQRDSRYLVGAGLVIAVLGIVAILAPLVTGLGLSLAFGTLLVVGGLAHVAHAFRARGWVGSFWQVLLAIVYTLRGLRCWRTPFSD
ncbi:HdeD family acid-resistance protein [Halomicroarcula sp. GCM10025709]|uniref:HdeD family acid-resistance protein n=1 Tax=Halomicroarcula sp. GCM10025709 TaxID=3252669 RepID=UPI003622A234